MKAQCVQECAEGVERGRWKVRPKGWGVLHYCPRKQLIYFSFETGSHYASQAGFELVILLSQPPGCWDPKYVSPCSALIHYFMGTLDNEFCF
jgi:hypothetical protein